MMNSMGTYGLFPQSTTAQSSFSAGGSFGTNPKAHVYKTIFPRAEDYTSLDAIKKTFLPLGDINNAHFDKVTLDNAIFFVIRSNNEDDVHKAIKYGVWTSTRRTNANLSSAFKENKGTPIYLIFSVVKSGQFVGVAQMMSEVDYNDSFAYWWEPLKWFGRMMLKWVFVKDIPAKEVQTVINLNEMRDGTRLTSEQGKAIMSKFVDMETKDSIFNSFNFMDQREDLLRHTRDTDFFFISQFDLMRKLAAENPELLTPPIFYNKKSGSGAGGTRRHYYGNPNRRPQTTSNSLKYSS